MNQREKCNSAKKKKKEKKRHTLRTGTDELQQSFYFFIFSFKCLRFTDVLSSSHITNCQIMKNLTNLRVLNMTQISY